MLGIDEARIALGFEYFDVEGEELLPDAAEFIPVGKAAQRKKAPSAQPVSQPAGPVFDMFSVVIALLTKCWSAEPEKQIGVILGNLPDPGKQICTELDRVARDWLKQSQLAGRPTFDELKAARDAGPQALADLLVERTPTQLGDIARSAVNEGMERFVGALLVAGLDPKVTDHHGQSLLSQAEKRGKDSAIYGLLKSALDKQG